MITHDTVISLIRAQPGFRFRVQTIACIIVCIIMNINGMRQSAPAVCSARYADPVSPVLSSKLHILRIARHAFDYIYFLPELA